MASSPSFSATIHPESFFDTSAPQKIAALGLDFDGCGDMLEDPKEYICSQIRKKVLLAYPNLLNDLKSQDISIKRSALDQLEATVQKIFNQDQWQECYRGAQTHHHQFKKALKELTIGYDHIVVYVASNRQSHFADRAVAATHRYKQPFGLAFKVFPEFCKEMNQELGATKWSFSTISLADDDNYHLQETPHLGNSEGPHAIYKKFAKGEAIFEPNVHIRKPLAEQLHRGDKTPIVRYHLADIAATFPEPHYVDYFFLDDDTEGFILGGGVRKSDTANLPDIFVPGLISYFASPEGQAYIPKNITLHFYQATREKGLEFRMQITKLPPALSPTSSYVSQSIHSEAGELAEAPLLSPKGSSPYRVAAVIAPAPQEAASPSPKACPQPRPAEESKKSRSCHCNIM